MVSVKLQAFINLDNFYVLWGRMENIMSKLQQELVNTLHHTGMIETLCFKLFEKSLTNKNSYWYIENNKLNYYYTFSNDVWTAHIAKVRRSYIAKSADPT